MTRAWLAAGCAVLAACGGGDARASETLEQPSAISAACVPPPDCLPIVSLVNIDVCCSDTLRCGFDLSSTAALEPMYPELTGVLDVDPDKPCWPRSQIYLKLPSSRAARVAVDGGPDVLIAPSCQSRVFAATPLPGCCLPDDSCGYDTHFARNTFEELSGTGAHPAFAEPRCWSASELNAQLEANGLAAWAYVPDASGECDYAALSAALR
jgi:hypothetical protein